MSELIALFRKASAEPTLTRRAGQAAVATHPEYLAQLLEYLREQKRSQGRALRAAIAALAEAD
jgi:hypothetical protein